MENESTLTFFVFINRKAAIAIGSSNYGQVKFKLDISELSHKQLSALNHLMDTHNGNAYLDSDDLGEQIAKADESMIIPWLDKIAAKQDAKVQSSLRRTHQLIDWVVNYGSDNQKARFDLDLLPEDEILHGIREQLFAPLSNMQRFKKLTGNDIDHMPTCNYVVKNMISHARLDTDTQDNVKLTESEYQFYQHISDLMPTATLAVKAHGVWCQSCGVGKVVKTISVQVTEGELFLTREYLVE